MKRTDFPQGYDTMRIDINSEGAYRLIGMTSRPYPRLMPVPFNTIAKTKALNLAKWRKNLQIYPQLYFIMAEDVKVGQKEIPASAVAGIGFGLGIMDDGILQSSPDPAPRDASMCHWYSLYSDDSQYLGEEMVPGFDVKNIVITMESETLGKKVFEQKNLDFGPGKLLAEADTIIEFRKNDLVTLGAADLPVPVAQDQFFKEGEVITLTVTGLAEETLTLEIPVEDHRDPAYHIPTWKPRKFFMGK